MRLIQKQIPRNANIFLFSCTHWGTPFQHVSGWEELVGTITSKYDGLPIKANVGIHHGDIIEAKELGHPHHTITTARPDLITGQIDQAIRELSKIRKHLVTILQGNHEQGLHRFGNVAEYIARHVGAVYGTYTSKITYVDPKGSILFKHFATHGRKPIGSTADDIIRQLSNQQLQLKRHLKFKAGDALLMSKGHTHKLFYVEPRPTLYLTDNGKRIKQKFTETGSVDGYINPDMRWYANVGAFFKMYSDEFNEYNDEDPLHSVVSSYAELAEYDPIELGFLIVKVRDGNIAGIDRRAVN